MKEKFFPVFINFKNKNCLVVGGGNISKRKIETLISYGADVEVIAPWIKEEINELVINFKLKITQREYVEEDLKNRFLVVAATDNAVLNSKIVEECEIKNILVNNITSKSDMNTRFCTVLEKEDHILGISGKGNPKKALEVKKRLIEM
ncbi:MAG: precorrin-2 dehydrogenase/sirohydrochlorin ferrochelatase family protein [Fusobacteriaceae bacterium]